MCGQMCLSLHVRVHISVAVGGTIEIFPSTPLLRSDKTAWKERELLSHLSILT